MQQGRYAGSLIHRRIVGKSAPLPFRYFDKGNLAVVGKGFAILQSGKVQLSGFLAWIVGLRAPCLPVQRNLRVSASCNGCGLI